MTGKVIHENESAMKLLNIEETKYKTQLTKKFESRKPWQKPDPSLIVSLIPGTVSKIFVKPNDKVAEGDKLLILDAMKMKNTIKVFRKGVVAKVNITEGQSIPKGFVMMELKPID
jgi:biotin carboxyl carrier protein